MLYQLDFASVETRAADIITLLFWSRSPPWAHKNKSLGRDLKHIGCIYVSDDVAPGMDFQKFQNIKHKNHFFSISYYDPCSHVHVNYIRDGATHVLVSAETITTSVKTCSIPLQHCGGHFHNGWHYSWTVTGMWANTSVTRIELEESWDRWDGENLQELPSSQRTRF